MTEIEVIHGPTVETTTKILYEVTLPSGMIVTNPQGFEPEEQAVPVETPYVTEDGRVLSVETYAPTDAPPETPES